MLTVSSPPGQSVMFCPAITCVSLEQEEEKPKKKRQSIPKKTFTEPFVDPLGWHVEPPSLIWRCAQSGGGGGGTYAVLQGRRDKGVGVCPRPEDPYMLRSVLGP